MLGYKRDAYIQIDAAERNYAFTYDGLDRNRYAEENRQIYRRRLAEAKGDVAEGQTTLRIPKTILKAAVPKEAYELWTAALDDPAKRAEIKAVYIKGMTKDGQSEPVQCLGQTQLRTEQDGLLPLGPRPGQTAGRTGTTRGREPHARRRQFRG